MKQQRLQQARAYYQTLNEHDYQALDRLIGDSIISKEGEYVMEYSKAGFEVFLRWDAAFDPNYEILSLAIADQTVVAEIKKTDTRLDFLLEGPSITKERLDFKDGKIRSVAIVTYLQFDDVVFSRNRKAFLDWMDAHHPELDGFIIDQTETGAKNYLEAIRLFQAREKASGKED
ncbi:hypothetical protein ABV409_12070 [Flagellimonas sp. DF-77]|uniref:hypothetical protein n=1 Tax=Flagellimonas algarum TaxID=3230298 RepID=UPI003399C8B7